MSKPERSDKSESPGAAAPPADAEWNISRPERRGGHEKRIALLLVVCLVGAVGAVIHRKVEERKAAAQSTAFQRPAGGDVVDAASPASSSTEQQESGAVSFEPWSSPQREPATANGDPAASAPGAESWAELAGDEATVPSHGGSNRSGDGATVVMSGHAVSEVDQNEQGAAGVEDEWNPFAAQPRPEPAGDGNLSVGDAQTTVYAPDDATPPTFAEPEEPLDAAHSGSTWTSDTQTATAQSSAYAAEASSAFDPLPSASTSRSESAGANASASEPFELFGSEPEGDVAEHDSPSAADAAEFDGPRLEPVPIPDREAVHFPAGNDNVGLIAESAADASQTAGDNPWESAPAESATGDAGAPVEFDFSTSPAQPIQTTGGQQADSGLFFETDGPAQPSADWERSAANDAPVSANPPDPFVQIPSARGTPAEGDSGIPVHTVRSGENFWTIARQHYGAGRYANALAAFNQSRIPDPRKMRPGMKVLIPDERVLSQQFPRLTGAAYGPYPAPGVQRAGFFIDSNGQPAYRVGRHDTLSEIAARCLGRSSRWVQVLGMNRDQLKDANSLKTGMVLRLPADATQVSVVSGEAAAR